MPALRPRTPGFRLSVREAGRSHTTRESGAAAFSGGGSSRRAYGVRGLDHGASCASLARADPDRAAGRGDRAGLPAGRRHQVPRRVAGWCCNRLRTLGVVISNRDSYVTIRDALPASRRRLPQRAWVNSPDDRGTRRNALEPSRSLRHLIETPIARRIPRQRRCDGARRGRRARHRWCRGL